MKFALDAHCQQILDEYDQNLSSFEKMGEIVRDTLERAIAHTGMYINAIETRVKWRNSLIGKLELKGHKYQSLANITDILGARVITFYADEVDKIAALVSKKFDIDWDNSIDKRKGYDLDKFGYMSLHYICRIPKKLYYNPEHPEINEFPFEIQMRTALQHVWATMNHDTGYKSGVEVPKEYIRNINRIAGMLELADEMFSNIRKEITDYRRNVQSLVASGNFDEVILDESTFRNYLELNPFKNLLEKIASINQAEIYEDNLMHYLEVLQFFGFTTLGDIQRMITECSAGAYKLALQQMVGTDFDILAQSLALQNLCIIYILKKGEGKESLQKFYEMIFGVSDFNQKRAERTLEQVEKMHF